MWQQPKIKKKSTHQLNSRLHIAKEKISELEFMSEENIQSIVQRDRKWKYRRAEKWHRGYIEKV